MSTASSRSLIMLRRNLLARRAFHSTALRNGGMSPPLPPFARNPARYEPMTENTDALWDDGVAPELALDFDVPNISTSEAIYTWIGGFSLFFIVYQTIKVVTGGAPDDNPALSHSTDSVVPNYPELACVPLEK